MSDTNKERIAKIEVYNLRVPLQETYHLSYGDVDFYDSIIALIYSEGGSGIGESTLLSGYCTESADTNWDIVEQFATELLGKTVESAKAFISSYSERFPFATTTFFWALEDLSNMWDITSCYKIPLVGVITSSGEKRIKKDLQKLLDMGFETIKIKVGSSIEDDIDRLRIVSSVVGNTGIRLRVDANQGYSFKEAYEFLKYIEATSNIEYIEQPLRRDAWEDLAAFADIASVPLCLDESVWSEADLEKVRDYGCSTYVKLKVMKHGGWLNTLRLSKIAERYNFKTILGNGVQTEIGCYKEALLYVKLNNRGLAGEMNGFLKQKESILNRPLEFCSGNLILRPGYLPLLNRSQIEKYLIKEKIWRLYDGA